MKVGCASSVLKMSDGNECEDSKDGNECRVDGSSPEDLMGKVGWKDEEGGG